jgi:hypothetical protein
VPAFAPALPPAEPDALAPFLSFASPVDVDPLVPAAEPLAPAAPLALDDPLLFMSDESFALGLAPGMPEDALPLVPAAEPLVPAAPLALDDPLLFMSDEPFALGLAPGMPEDALPLVPAADEPLAADAPDDFLDLSASSFDCCLSEFFIVDFWSAPEVAEAPEVPVAPAVPDAPALREESSAVGSFLPSRSRRLQARSDFVQR